jgi:hypothetical protein
VGSACNSARAGEAYYLLMFASQRPTYSPNYAHTFTTFVRASWPGDGPCPPQNVTLEAHTISWLPSNLVIRIQALLPECGHNFGLAETIRFALGTEQRVSLWGPYQIEPDLYARAMQRVAQLNSGSVRYKANDSLYDRDRVTNCIHAVDAITERLRVRVASPGWGDTASYVVLMKMRQSIIDMDRPHYWVASALGLDCYPIIYRDARPFRTGWLLGPMNRLCGKERDLVPTYGPPH